MPQRFKYLLGSFELVVFLSGIGKLLYWIFVFLTPVHETIGILLAVVVCNLFMGLVAILRHKERFSFSKFAWACSKFILYPVVIITGFLLDSLIPGIPIVEIFAGMIGVWEGESMGRNFNRIYGFNVFKAVKVWIANRNRDWSDIRDEFQRKYQDPKASPPSEGED